MFTYVLYAAAATGLVVSFFKDKGKTRMALKKAWKSFENILPQFLMIMLIIGFALTVLDANTISKLMGAESGLWGMFGAAVIGAITLIPGFVAFPLAAALLQGGAGYMQIAAFVSALTMVGIITMPMEIKTFGKKLTVLRNALAFVFSILAALVIGGVM